MTIPCLESTRSKQPVSKSNLGEKIFFILCSETCRIAQLLLDNPNFVNLSDLPSDLASAIAPSSDGVVEFEGENKRQNERM